MLLFSEIEAPETAARLAGKVSDRLRKSFSIEGFQFWHFGQHRHQFISGSWSGSGSVDGSGRCSHVRRKSKD